MIVVRHAQMAALANAGRRQFVLVACAYLRRQFHDRLWSLPEVELERHVGTALARAAQFGLQSERDCYRYLNLCIFHGWDFTAEAGNAWMRDMLADAAGGPPGARLHRLVGHCIRRSAIETANQVLEQAWAFQPGRDGAEPQEHAMDDAFELDTLLPIRASGGAQTIENGIAADA
jgi:hypothetical protein